eukprot:3733353-Pyramimonas_sp.AAC.1
MQPSHITSWWRRSNTGLARDEVATLRGGLRRAAGAARYAGSEGACARDYASSLRANVGEDEAIFLCLSSGQAPQVRCAHQHMYHLVCFCDVGLD